MRFARIVAIVIFLTTLLSVQAQSGPSFPLPEFLGVYAVTGGQLVELREVLDESRYRLVRQDNGLLIAGIFPLSGISVEGGAFFIAYKQVRPVRYSIAKLQASRIRGVEMYVPFQDLMVRIAPVEGREGMTRVVSAQPLPKGLYVFYLWTPVMNSLEGAVSLFRDTRTHAVWLYDFELR